MKDKVRFMPNYTREGKIQTPLSDEDFAYGMEHGKFLNPEHRAYCIALYYSAARCREVLKATREQFQITRSAIMFDVGQRLKHSKSTPALKIPLKAPYAVELKQTVESTMPKQPVFPYCRKTGYNIVRRAFKYPHLFRLSRITNFFLDGWTVAQVRSWTGLTLSALEYYVGLVDIAKMGESMARGSPSPNPTNP
jgi:integrase